MVTGIEKFRFAAVILIIALLFVSIEHTVLAILLDHACFYTSFFSVINQDTIWSSLFCIILLLSLAYKQIGNIAGVGLSKNEAYKVARVLVIVPVLMWGYTEFFFANLGYGACSKEGVNANYYNAIGQDKYIK